VLVDVAEEGALDHVLRLIVGIPAKTVLLFVSSVSNRARTAAAASAAPVLRRATVSDLVQLANSLECWAFISSSICGVKWGGALPAVSIWMMRRTADR
jgi:hypothetical protein